MIESILVRRARILKVYDTTQPAGAKALLREDLSVSGVLDKPAPILVASATIGGTATAAIGANSTLTISVLPANATDKTGSWSSGTPANATVDQTGKVTGVAAGKSIITWTAKDGSGVTATKEFTVTTP